ncbi:phosphopantetheine binding protein [Nocardia tenerifensis]|uniref:Phosphopantetheine binding protein n=1 Tax=Nocardia tenerifensis TaxID=228006 RepID=A0A318K2N9_9NOCA|nr:phosphopantetheine binding protein [Nocardia tenerifensis]
MVGRVCGPDFTEPTANFYELGGDSLLAGELMTGLRTEFGVELPMTLVFEAPDMGAFVDDAAGEVTQRGGS